MILKQWKSSVRLQLQNLCQHPLRIHKEGDRNQTTNKLLSFTLSIKLINLLLSASIRNLVKNLLIHLFDHCNKFPLKSKLCSRHCQANHQCAKCKDNSHIQ